MDSIVARPPTTFWIVGVLLLLWEAVGCAFYVMEAMSGAVEATPVWSTALYALAVWGGLLAAILLLLRRRWATPLFLLALLAAAARSLLLSSAVEASALPLTLTILIVGAFAVWWSHHSTRRGWLR